MNKIANRALNISPSLTLVITAKANKMRAEGVDVVSLGVGEPDCNTPDYILNKAHEGLDKGITRYTPSAGTVDLRNAICQKLKNVNGLEYSFNQIVVSNGAKHSLYNALMAIVDEGDEVIVPSPYWLTYPELIRLCGGKPVFVEPDKSNNLKVMPSQIEAAITNKTKAIIFNNPSNPSGVVYDQNEVKNIAKVLEKADIYVIADEIYEEFSYSSPIYSIAAYSQKVKDNTILVNGMSKTYAMTGWRIGYTASTLELAKAMESIQSHATSNPNSIAQYASVAALTDEAGKDFILKTKTRFEKRKNMVLEGLKKIPDISFIEPQGAFYVMVDIHKLFNKVFYGTKISTALDFANMLLDKAHVVVIPCEAFGAPDYIRLSYATSEAAIEKALARLKDFVMQAKD